MRVCLPACCLLACLSAVLVLVLMLRFSLMLQRERRGKSTEPLRRRDWAGGRAGNLSPVAAQDFLHARKDEKKRRRRRRSRDLLLFFLLLRGGFFLLFRIPLMLLAARFQLRLRVCLVDSRVTSLAGL